MAAEYKLEVLRAVEGSVLPVTQALAQLQNTTFDLLPVASKLS